MSESSSSTVRATTLETCLKPFPSSEKTHVQGSRADLQVPLRRVKLQPTREFDGTLTPNESILLYDTTGPYTDPNAQIDLAKGLAPLRLPWILERADVEELAASTSVYRQLRERDADLDAIRFQPHRRPLRAKAGKNVTQMHYARQGIVTPEIDRKSVV